jgi:hypothetical protein
MLFAIAEVRHDVREIREWLKEGEDGQAPEEDS